MAATQSGAQVTEVEFGGARTRTVLVLAGVVRETQGLFGPWCGSEVPGAGLPRYSVPTLINEDAMHAAAMRLDYALASAALTERCTITSTIAQDAETEKLSDHYPLLTDLDCEAW